MKIAFLFGTMGRGGAERVIASLSNTLVRGGDEVSIITLDHAGSGYELDPRVKLLQLDLAGRSANALQAIRRNARKLRALRGLVRREHFDVVVSFEIRNAILLLLACPLGRKYKVIASERSHPKHRRLGRLERLLRKVFLPSVDGFIFQTRRVSACYSKRVQKKGVVIPNGVFPEILPDVVPDFAARDHHQICAVGRLTAQKGYDVMIRAFEAFSRTHPGYTLHIYGKGDLEQELKQLAESVRVRRQIVFHGSVPNVTLETVKAGMFVMTSRFEGMPNALMEAMACGIPCVATDCEFGPGELIRDGENGLLVPVDDVPSVAAAMARIAEDPTLAERLSVHGQEIRQTYSGERIAGAYRQYMDLVVNGRER